MTYPHIANIFLGGNPNLCLTLRLKSSSCFQEECPGFCRLRNPFIPSQLDISFLSGACLGWNVTLLSVGLVAVSSGLSLSGELIMTSGFLLGMGRLQTLVCSLTVPLVVLDFILFLSFFAILEGCCLYFSCPTMYFTPGVLKSSNLFLILVVLLVWVLRPC